MKNRNRCFLLSLLVLILCGFRPGNVAPILAQLPDILKPKKIPLGPRPSPDPDLEEPSPGSQGRDRAPRIAWLQAAEFLVPGDVWEVYLVLEDEDANLKSLEWELRQEGPGGLSRGVIPLVLPRDKPKEGQEKFKEDEIARLGGYLSLDTGGPDVLRRPGRFDGLRLTLTLVAVDRRGMRSERRTLPLTLKLNAPQQQLRPVYSGVSLRHRIGNLTAVFPDPLRKP